MLPVEPYRKYWGYPVVPTQRPHRTPLEPAVNGSQKDFLLCALHDDTAGVLDAMAHSERGASMLENGGAVTVQADIDDVPVRDGIRGGVEPREQWSQVTRWVDNSGSPATGDLGVSPDLNRAVSSSNGRRLVSTQRHSDTATAV